jgi:hypothetical protein
MALEGHFEITVSLAVHDMNMESSRKLDRKA